VLQEQPPRFQLDGRAHGARHKDDGSRAPERPGARAAECEGGEGSGGLLGQL
jgi:hypothetical protein